MSTARKFVPLSRVVATLGVAAAFVAPLATTPIASPALALACQKATIGGESKCIAAGQYCARAHQSDYKKYGYSCSKKDKNGRYHLV